MTIPKIQIDDLVRDMNEEELTQYEIEQAAIAKVKSDREASALARAALLQRLGITADEAALLLG
jgi:hypothetical protein